MHVVRDLDTWISSTKLDDKCSCVVKQLTAFAKCCSLEKFGFFKKELAAFFSNRINAAHSLRANGIKAYIMSLVRPELEL